MTLSDLLSAIHDALTTPLGGLAGLPDVGPSPLQAAGGLFWLFMAGFSWWFVKFRSRELETEGSSIAMALTAIGLRILASSLCILLAVDILGLVSGAELVSGTGRIFSMRITELGGQDVLVSTVLITIVMVAATFWATALLHRITIRTLSDQGLETTGTIGVLLSLGRYVLIIVGLAVALTTAGINLTALFTVGAVFAVTIGFALQNIAQNFVSGVILLVEGAITPSDVLEVEGRVVRVIRMGIRSTVVRSMDDEDLILPNAVLAQGTVKNLTMEDDTLRIGAAVSVAYASDLDRVKGILAEAGSAVPQRDWRRDPLVLLQSFGDSGIVFEVLVWIPDPWLAPLARSELRLAIWRAFRDQEVTIPFHQVDIHMIEPVSLVGEKADRAS